MIHNLILNNTYDTVEGGEEEADLSSSKVNDDSQTLVYINRLIIHRLFLRQ